MKRIWGIVLLLIVGLVLIAAGLVPGEAARAQTKPGQTTERQIIEPAPEEIVPNSGFYLPAEPETDAENIELVGHIGGASYAVAVQGSFAYIGEGPWLTILNISNPANPVMVGSMQLPGIVFDVAVAGNYAYVAVHGAGLQIISVANPATPAKVGFYDVKESAWDVVVSANHAFVAAGDRGLRIINVANPAAPTEVGFFDAPGFVVHAVAVAGGHAYVAAQERGLRIINVANPAAPTEVSFFDTPGWARDVVVSGNYAYIADVIGGLRIIDVTDPTSPTEAGFYAGHFSVVAVVGNYAYVDDFGLGIIDVTNPSTPIQISSHRKGFITDVAVANMYAYAADGHGGLQIITIANPAAPAEVGFYDTPGYAYSVVVAGNYAYVAAGASGLWIIDISNPATPTYVSHFDTPHHARDVAVAGDYAYVADQSSGLRVINVANPAAPSEVGIFPVPPGHSILAVAVAGSYAYLAGGEGLWIINIADPAAPTMVGGHGMPGAAWDVAVAGNYAYVATWESGLRIINIANPAGPAEVGSYGTPGYYTGVAVAGEYAYVADSSSGLRVISIANPAAPTEVGFYDTPGPYTGVAVAGNYASVAGGVDGVRIIDVANPTAPAEAGFYNTPVDAHAVTVAGNYAYVADGEGGLLILRFNSPPLELRFRPDPDGFYFWNYSACGVISVEDARYLFGDSAVCIFIPGHGCLEDLRAYVWRKFVNTAACTTAGRCAGMAATSLMLYLGLGPDSRDEPTDFFGAETTYRITPSAIQSYVDANQLRQTYSPLDMVLKTNRQLKPSQVLDAIREGISSGTNPVVVDIRPITDDSGHSLVPYQVEEKESGQYLIRVYDPNRPWPANQNDSYLLIINTNNETWSYPFRDNEMWAGTETSHTLSYAPIADYTQQLRCPWCGFERNLGDVIESKTIILAGESRALISNAGGLVIGYVDGEFVNNIPGASASPNYGGLGQDSSIVYHVPNNDSYSVRVVPDTNWADPTSPTGIALFGPNQGVLVENVVSNGAEDALVEINQTANGVRLAAGTSQEVIVNITADDSQRSSLYQLSGVDAGSGDVVDISYLNQQSRLIIDYADAGSGAYNLLIDSVSAAGKDQFAFSGISISGTDTHMIDVGNWQDDGYVTLSIDEGSDGTIDEEIELGQPSGGNVYLPLILR